MECIVVLYSCSLLIGSCITVILRKRRQALAKLPLIVPTRGEVQQLHYDCHTTVLKAIEEMPLVLCILQSRNLKCGIAAPGIVWNLGLAGYVS